MNIEPYLERAALFPFIVATGCLSKRLKAFIELFIVLWFHIYYLYSSSVL